MGCGGPDAGDSSKVSSPKKRLRTHTCVMCEGLGLLMRPRTWKTKRRASPKCPHCRGEGYITTNGLGEIVKIKSAWAKRDYSVFDFGDCR